MKVCTDACLFGAYVAQWMQEHCIGARKALDIGAGTGLLSLMLAQKTELEIDALEIDPAAATQAKENFAATPWKGRLNIFERDATSHCSDEAYDLIFSNPPFFEADLRSPDEGKNAAKHDTGLTLDQLAVVADRNLKPGGFFAILLPYHRVEAFIKMAGEYRLHLHYQVLVQHTKGHPYFRGILVFGRTIQQPVEITLPIKENGGYSAQFSALLRDYYLYL